MRIFNVTDGHVLKFTMRLFVILLIYYYVETEITPSLLLNVIMGRFAHAYKTRKVHYFGNIQFDGKIPVVRILRNPIIIFGFY